MSAAQSSLYSEREEARRTSVRVEFDRWRQFLGGLRRSGLGSRGCEIYERVLKATSAIREYRYVMNQRVQDNELEVLAIRIAADAFASQIAAAADQNKDPDTIAWVVAGLRCAAQPFCIGCAFCQTVTSPHRRVEMDPQGGTR